MRAQPRHVEPRILFEEGNHWNGEIAPCWSANRKLAEIASMNTIRIRLGHESLDVTLAYLKGKDAESEEAQEHANNSSLALYA
jgi:hypothetical protein